MVIPKDDTQSRQISEGRKEFHENMKEMGGLFTDGFSEGSATQHRDAFLSSFDTAKKAHATNYVEAIQSLPADVSAKGTLWLESIIDTMCMRAAALMPSLNLFRK
jgi:transposase-like protein